MARQSITIALIALASAILAAFVPGISDASGSVVGQVAATGAGDHSGHGAGGAEAGTANVVIAAGPKVADAKPAAAQRSRRIPIGCERTVSPLVRSAYATQVARCVT